MFGVGFNERGFLFVFFIVEWCSDIFRGKVESDVVMLR